VRYSGETFVGEKSDGSKFYAEVLRHNPIKLAMLMTGPDNCYQSYEYPTFKFLILLLFIY
jgi:hypothetical protein